MTDFSTLMSQGNAWLFIPSAILLGALHGLEPWHSKTMMAAFIIAVKGTVKQAILLGLAATVSHTAIVWIVALGGMYLGSQFQADTVEPYLQVVSALLIFSVAGWMLWRTWKQQKACFNGENNEHSHHHHDESKLIDTGHGTVKLDIFEDGVPPCFRFSNVSKDGQIWTAEEVKITTTRPDWTVQVFAFVQKNGFLESIDAIPEPHEFHARMSLGHDDHSHDYDIEFIEHNHHHVMASTNGINVETKEYQDAHELAHANDIKRKFADTQEVTTGQIIMFGLTGWLIPCPASITVLLLCLQLKKITLWAVLVLSFSIGLALTMILSGTIAAISIRQASKHWSGFGNFARKMPYFSSVLMILIGCYIGYEGLIALV